MVKACRHGEPQEGERERDDYLESQELQRARESNLHVLHHNVAHYGWDLKEAVEHMVDLCKDAYYRRLLNS